MHLDVVGTVDCLDWMEMRMQSSAQYYRQLEKSDLSAVERLLNTSEYIYQRFTMEELELLL